MSKGSLQGGRGRWLRTGLVLGLCVAGGHAQAAQTLSLAQFGQELAQAQAAVGACEASASDCHEERAPANGQVAASVGHPPFAADWDWLRSTLEDARSATAHDRATAMQAAAGQLEELASEAAQPSRPASPALVSRAQTTAVEVLAGAEFAGANQQPSWWDRLVARIQDWIFRLLTGLGVAGSRHPWLAPAIEWSCFALAAAGLVLSILRGLRRQNLRLRLGDELAVQRAPRDNTDWVQQAARYGAAGAWREGVHSLYWAAIASLENRRAWRPNPTRTPREYLSLLRPGSEAQRALRELTRSLERLWYGQGVATETDLRDAQVAYGRVAAADLRHPEAVPGRAALSQAEGV